MRLDTILAAQALRHPAKTAVICGEARVTYKDLAATVTRVAGALSRRGVKAGDRIVLFMPNGLPIIELIYAAFTLGAVVVPVTTRLTVHELGYICDDCQPAAIAFETGGIEGILDAHPHAVRIGPDYKALREEPPAPLPRLPVEPDDAMIMYTSGTTGRPKGAINTHSNLASQHAFMNAIEWGMSHADIFLVTTPLAHRTGFGRLANALALGGTLVVMSRFDPRQAVETIAREGVTVAGMVPTVCRMLLPEIEADPTRCASLRRVVVTGEAFPTGLKRRLIAALPDLRLVSFFAMTEAGGVTSLSHEEQFTHPESVGRATPGVELRLVADDGTDVELGEAGELWVRSGAPGRFAVMRAYFNRPEDTAAVFEDGWIRTGDMGRMDADGYLFIVDRKKDMVLSGGLNIYTKEVEQALVTFPGVADAAVIGIPDDMYGESVVAFVERTPGADPAPAAIIEHVRTLIASYKKPKHVFVVDTLPRNSLGKVLKRDLRTTMDAHADTARP